MAKVRIDDFTFMSCANSMNFTFGANEVHRNRFEAGRLLVWSTLMLFTGFALAWLIVRSTVLGSVLEIGGDEHFELMKGLLWSHGYPLYSRIWDDQPPLYTVLLGCLFGSFEPTIVVARSLAVFFAMFLFSGFFLLVEKYSGTIAACVATACLVAAPRVMELSFSVMQEAPMLACSMWGAYMLYRSFTCDSKVFLFASGAVFGIALEIKLTAAIMITATAATLLLDSEGKSKANIFSRLAEWMLCVLCTAFILTLAFGGNYSQMWGTHISKALLDSSPAKDLRFDIGLVTSHVEALCGGIACLFVLAVRRQVRPILLPLVALGITTAVYVPHRPWFEYYYLHFAFPLCWLTGYATAQFLQPTTWPTWKKGLGLSYFPFLAASTLLCLMVVYGGQRLFDAGQRVANIRRIEKNPILSALRSYAVKGELIYTRATIYAFHAKVLVPPELAVLSPKRFWSGQINDEMIQVILTRYEPRLLLLGASPDSKEVAYMGTNYNPVYAGPEYTIYVRRESQKSHSNDREGKSKSTDSAMTGAFPTLFGYSCSDSAYNLSRAKGHAYLCCCCAARFWGLFPERTWLAPALDLNRSCLSSDRQTSDTIRGGGVCSLITRSGDVLKHG